MRCHANLAEKVKEKIEPLISSYIITSPEQKASERLIEQITLLEKSIVIIDEATGGVLQTLLDCLVPINGLNFMNKRIVLFISILVD